MDWTAELVDQLDWHWNNHLLPRLEGLGDAEYLWKPVAGAWSIRPRAGATSGMAAGSGEIVIDFEMPEPAPAPVTTMAWRMAHISVEVFGMRAHSHFGAPPITYHETDWTMRAADGLDLLRRTYDGWIGGVRSLSPADLERPCGPAEGPFADHPMAALVLHINREAIHHGAEICLLRDLYLRNEEDR